MLTTIQKTDPRLNSGKHYRFRLIGRGPNLLILGGSSEDWEGTVELLSSHFTLIIPSFSKAMLLKQEASPDPMFYIQGLLQELGIVKYAVLAHSLSAWLGLRLAALYPDRVDKLVLANLPSLVDDKFSFEQLHRELVARHDRIELDSSFWFDQIYPLADDLMRARTVLRTLPYMVIVGDRDRFFSREKLASWLVSEGSKVCLEEVRFSGHFTMRDNPWYFSALVRAFLEAKSYQSVKSQIA